jgi:hypothetical protein
MTPLLFVKYLVMGDTNRPSAIEDNLIPLFAARSSRTSGTVLVANDQLAGSNDTVVPTDETPASGEIGTRTVEIRSLVTHADGAITGAQVLAFPSPKDRLSGKTGIQSKHQHEIADVKMVGVPRPANVEVPTHPDEDEISQFPQLVEFLAGMDPGFETVANVFCKIRLAQREAMIERGIWRGAANEMPDSQYWPEPTSLEYATQKLESPEVEALADRASDPDLSDDVQDLAYDELFGVVASTLLFMERRFLRMGFNDEFIKSLCDHLIESIGQKEKGVRKLILDKIGPNYKQFIAQQMKDRWGIKETTFPSTDDSTTSANSDVAIDMNAE